MGWSTSWHKPEIEQDKLAQGFVKDGKHTPLNEVFVEAAPFTEEAWNNLKPTHDPYTNPNAFLYYECECGKRLDPRTKSFAALNNAASDANWKVRWGPNSYVPYCPKCVEEKGIE